MARTKNEVLTIRTTAEVKALLKLAAVPVEADMSVSQVAARLAEYSFSRIDKPTARPRIYRAEQVGVDSDGYASIRPVETLREPADEIIEAIDTGAARAIELRESIAADERRLARVTDQFAREIIEAAIARNRAKLCGAS